jgi:hypothetical protein
MLPVVEAQLRVSGPGGVSAHLAEDLGRLEVVFDRNIAGSQPCELVFAPATAALLNGRNSKQVCYYVRIHKWSLLSNLGTQLSFVVRGKLRNTQGKKG